MEPAESTWRPLGELLVDKGLLAPAELELALAEQVESGRPLGAILVERGYVSGRAFAIALAEQSGVDLQTERGFGTGLWAEIDRRHRAVRGASKPVPAPESDNVVRLAPAKLAPVAAEPDAVLDRLQAENRRLQDELERLRRELGKPRLVEPSGAPAASHLLFVPTATGYALVERDGPPPQQGCDVELAEAELGIEGGFVVAKVGGAPLPAERRSCAYLLRR